jgi:hypothetical protein
VRDLLALLQDAGHADFRDARGPMSFTQRQAGGKFTRDEAAAFIEQLENAESGEVDKAFSGIPTERLAEELRRRGWTVKEP